MDKIAAIVLAAGKGKRMKAKQVNKVVVHLGNKQMILHIIDRLKELLISPIIVVVGFAKESVMRVLGDSVIFAEQSRRLGTAHAVKCALKKLPNNIQTVLVLGGDDSAFYTKKTIKDLIEIHLKNNAALSFLTVTVDNPVGLGRVIRGNDDKVISIVEDKDATVEQKKINEINSGCYIFKVSFLKEYLKRVKRSPISGEYYLTSLFDIAMKNNQRIEALKGGKILWRGINTRIELEEAEKLLLEVR